MKAANKTSTSCIWFCVYPHDSCTLTLHPMCVIISQSLHDSTRVLCALVCHWSRRASGCACVRTVHVLWVLIQCVLFFTITPCINESVVCVGVSLMHVPCISFFWIEHGLAQTSQYNSMFHVVSPWEASASLHQAHNISSDSMHLGPQAAQHWPLKSMFCFASLV